MKRLDLERTDAANFQLHYAGLLTVLLLLVGCSSPKRPVQTPAVEQAVDWRKQHPPAPMAGGITPLHGWQVVEEFYSPDKSEEVMICHRGETFLVRSFQWWTGEWATKGNAWWIQGDLLKEAKSLDDARQIAKDYMGTKWGTK